MYRSGFSYRTDEFYAGTGFLMSSFRRLKFKEFIEIQKARKAVGLPPLRMDYKNCLRCGKRFFSEDCKNQHNCNICREDDVIDRETKTKTEENL